MISRMNRIQKHSGESDQGLVIKRPEWCSIRIVLMRGDALVPYACASIVRIWSVTLVCDHLVCFVQTLPNIREAAILELSYVDGQQHGARHRWYADQTRSQCPAELNTYLIPSDGKPSGDSITGIAGAPGVSHFAIDNR